MYAYLYTNCNPPRSSVFPHPRRHQRTAKRHRNQCLTSRDIWYLTSSRRGFVRIFKDTEEIDILRNALYAWKNICLCSENQLNRLCENFEVTSQKLEKPLQKQSFTRTSKSVQKLSTTFQKTLKAFIKILAPLRWSTKSCINFVLMLHNFPRLQDRYLQ